MLRLLQLRHQLADARWRVFAGDRLQVRAGFAPQARLQRRHRDGDAALDVVGVASREALRGLDLGQRVVALPRFPVEVSQLRIGIGGPGALENRRGPAMLAGGDQQLGVSGRRRRVAGIGMKGAFGQLQRAVGRALLTLLSSSSARSRGASTGGSSFSVARSFSVISASAQRPARFCKS